MSNPFLVKLKKTGFIEKSNFEILFENKHISFPEYFKDSSKSLVNLIHHQKKSKFIYFSNFLITNTTLIF
jgi:hypothetical protein